MTMKKISVKKLTISVLALSLTACTSMVSEGINDAGVAKKVVFPVTDSAWNSEGIFPTVDNLRQIAPGVTKDDLYYLLGRPHFKEMHGAREWDYIFKFRDDVDTPVKTCQYKIIFDKDMRGQSFYWQPHSCSAHFYQTLVDLSADTLFPFDRGSTVDISATGKSLLRQLATKIKQEQPSANLHILGYTDHLGSQDYNQRLSLSRAESVKKYLVQQNIAADKITVIGKGDSDPVVRCRHTDDRTALIKCLAPNRRVRVVLAPY